ncbi:MAG: hypothetical protein KJ597_04320 [Nanoarchaeota archaeon]|nr:hypothetical protein [Nanoarchaeota archaeon]MBU1622773.1 hypothetical protein [Nanoarchaeota archaeon]
MVNNYLPILLAVIISITYYYSNKYKIKHKEWNRKIVSFSAGVSITYLLLELFPTFTEAALSLDKIIFISIPIGFIIHHILEKEIYIHNKRRELIRMLTLEENVFSFVYHLIIGVTLVTFAKGSATSALLFFIPMLSFTFLSNLPANSHPLKIKAIFLSSATLIGAITALLWTTIPTWLEISLMGLAIGILLFTIIRHHIPFGRRGHIGYITIGFIIYSILIIVSWYI